jgi:amino acid permease
LTEYEQRRIVGIVLIIVGVFVFPGWLFIGFGGTELLGLFAVLAFIIIGVILIVRKDPEVTHLDSHFGRYFCSKCGTNLESFNQYCAKCGTPV